MSTIFFSFQKPDDPEPDSNSCEKINEEFKTNEDYNFVNYFGNEFDLLKKGADSLEFPTKNKMNAIFFVGNTGAGKSTLVQILGGDNSKIFSVPVTKDEEDFVIADNSRIGNSTIVSETLYPELVVDKETGFVLCDNPGFRDTRSPVHEIMAIYSMKKVLQHTEKIKIVIVVTHSSVKRGMFREDFINVLRHSIEFINDIDQYKDSFYLIANKVENTYIRNQNDEIEVINDESIIDDIGEFLKEVSFSITNGSYTYDKFNSVSKHAFINNAKKIISVLLETDNGNYKRIKILRKPAAGGAISDNPIIQINRNEIRDALLNHENMININNTNFGLTLTDSAKLYLSNLFATMNSYTTDLSNMISSYITDYYGYLINSWKDFNDIVSSLMKMKNNAIQLSKDIETAHNPSQFMNIISNFSEENKLQLDCLIAFKNISILTVYLSNLKEFSYELQYSSASWRTSIGQIAEFTDDNLNKYLFLQKLYEYLNSYEIQKVKRSYRKVSQKVNKIFGINLPDPSQVLMSKDEFSKKLYFLTTDNMSFNRSWKCTTKTMVITDKNVLFSEVASKQRHLCDREPRKIVILAMRTVLIDTDLDFLRGKDVMIIAPTWHVIGSRMINIDGINGGEALPKAGVGEIGKPGLNGKSGGKFYGIGMNFINGENLIISSSGGDGQDGQAGGDGEDGSQGETGDEINKQQVDTQGFTIPGVLSFKDNVFLARGTPGQTGGDAGAGGVGGTGGKQGFIIIHNIGLEEHGITTITEPGKPGKNGKDGKPGKGGVKGCDQVIKKKTIDVMGYQFEFGNDKSIVNCQSETKDGKVRRGQKLENKNESEDTNNDSPVCVYIEMFQKYYVKELQSTLNDGVTKAFIHQMKTTKF